MKIEVLTLFPEFVEQVTRHGMPRIAVEGGQLQLSTRNPRDFAQNRWRKVDDRSYGGGPGMVMNAEPLALAIAAARESAGAARVVSLSPQGEPLTQAWVERLSREPALIVVCGRYEGLDERVVAAEVDFELSLGDFVLSGGELAAMALIDAIARLLPGVLGDEGSAANDSFARGLLDHPHYTRPEGWRGEAVPEVLLSGDHEAVRRWRLKQALGQTWLKRPDLLAGLELDAEQTKLLREFITEDPREAMSKIIQALDAEQMDKKVPEFRTGDTVEVKVKVKEGDRERLQAFEGVVIAKRKRGLNSAFTVRKVSHGEGVERVFQTYSKQVAEIKVTRRGEVARSKLYYLRDLAGKAARIKEKLT